MNFLERLYFSLKNFESNNAFMVEESYFNYAYLAKRVAAIRKEIKEKVDAKNLNVGIYIGDGIDTYAAILACWFEGKAYVPLHPKMPKERINYIVAEADVSVVIADLKQEQYPEYIFIETDILEDVSMDSSYAEYDENRIAYIFFTSGTTGKPKGVPITLGNLNGFAKAYEAVPMYSMTASDRCLQMFDLTFDLSVMSYLMPLLNGACVYPIPANQIKFSYIYQLMEDEGISVALMVPSILSYLRPYFDEMRFSKMRLSMFCGEALALDVVEEWSKCIPNADILNMYGPTEDTIYCTHYQYSRNGENKSHNGILSIGKSMLGTEVIIIDSKNQPLPSGEKGELCLSGVQLTPGYWKNEKKNKETFFELEDNGEKTRYYKTGDLCEADEVGDIMYLGRIDFQVKIQGFRVELSGIEFEAKKYLGKTNAVAVAYETVIGNLEIGLFIESEETETQGILEYLSNQFPPYMMPKKVVFMNEFPLNQNGKVDRKAMKKTIES